MSSKVKKFHKRFRKTFHEIFSENIIKSKKLDHH